MKKNKNNHEFHTFETYHPGNGAGQSVKKVRAGKGKRYATINAWLKKHHTVVLVAIIVVALGLGGSIIYLFNHLSFQTITVTSIKKKVPPKFYSPLTGVEVPESDTQRPVTAVMIENSPQARPQSGLKEAGVVFESVAEGGITRFLVLYQEGKPALIGPVRSVRPQFASWAAAFDAGLAHVGGSAIPLAKLRSGQIKDLDQFFNSGAYWRASDRYAPHNVYTTTARLDALNRAKHYTHSTFTSWPRTKKEVPSPTPNAKNIAMPVSTGAFAVNYGWDQASNTYSRNEGGVPHVDREKGRITPKVVIAIQIPHNVIKDSNGYSYPNVIGSGKGWLFQDGTVVEIRWSKSSDKAQIRFTDTNGKDVKLERGQTWITDLPSTAVPTWH